MGPQEGSGKPASRPVNRLVSYRSTHRARSHDSAHAGAEPAPPARHLDHPLVPTGPAALVERQPDLVELIDHLRSAGKFAYDSEFIGELTYVPKLCLIQVASPQRVALIDPLVELDLRPFFELLADPAVEKIVHAGQQDLEPVVRILGRAPANVFDTQISAGFIGLPYPVSLSKLVNELTGVKLGKGLTFSHWDQRPLSAMQLRYAADDVRYLPLLRERIGERLSANGHARWAAEECAAQCDPKLFQYDPDEQFTRIRGAGGLPPRGLGILRELARWRNDAARKADVPPRALLKDEVLIELARNPVKSIEKLDRIRGLPRPIEAEYGTHLVELTARAAAIPESELPSLRDVEPTPTEKFRTDSFWAAAQALSASKGIDLAVASNRQEIGEFYRHLMQPRRDDKPHPMLTGWRREALGEPLKNLLEGKAQIALKWTEQGLAS